MLNITELTERYIETNYTPELQKTIFYSFMLQEMLSNSFYEERYTNLISRENSIDSDEKRDLFVKYLNEDITAIINSHFITLNEEADIRLFERNEIAHFIYIIQNLEDYEEFSYMVNSSLPPRIVLCNLITQYSLLPQARAMEVVGEVETKLITALKEYTKEKKSIADKKVDKDFVFNVVSFMEFTKGTTSLGYRLYLEGYNKVTLTELSELVNFNIAEYVDRNINTNQAQTCLDVFSLLVTTRDNYGLPLLKFKQNSSIFTNNLENVTKLNNGMLSMLSDFNSFLQAKKEGLKNVN